jgi:hypothetical protein
MSLPAAKNFGQIIEYIPGKNSLRPFLNPWQRISTALGILAVLPVANLSHCYGFEAMADCILSPSTNMLRDSENAFTSAAIIHGQPLIFPWTVLTYCPDRLYLAAYTSTPGPETLFPYPVEQRSKRSPSKRSARAVDGPAAVSEKQRNPPYYFSIDETLLYNAFHHDFGPLHIGHLYRFAVQFHDILGAPENKGRPVVFWSKADARST